MKLPKLPFDSIIQYLKIAFSDNGSPSSSRLLTLMNALVACGCLIYVTVKNHALPDGTTLMGLGAFATAQYAVNRATNAWGKAQSPKPDVNLPPSASSDSSSQA